MNDDKVKHILWHRPERGAKPVNRGTFATYTEALRMGQALCGGRKFWVDSKRYYPNKRRWIEFCPTISELR